MQYKLPKVKNESRGNKASLSAEYDWCLIIARNKLGPPSNTFIKLELIYYILNGRGTGLLTCSEQFKEVASNRTEKV
jgi:hypothetical protein